MTHEQLKTMEPLFGSWHIVREIGHGGFGSVYEIERKEFGETYKAALKVITIPRNQGEIKGLKSNGMNHIDTSKYYEDMVKDMTKEFSLMDKVKGNTNIVTYSDHQVIKHADGIGWDILIRMELLTPLYDYIAHHRMDDKEIIKLGIDICRALEICEKHNIIHRDIKIDNIFVSSSGDFKLGDFGIARTMDRSHQASTQIGTWDYCAPEVLMGSKYTSNVDMYSLGLVLYRLLNCNRMPFLPFYPQEIKYSDTELAKKRRMSGEPVPDIPGRGNELNRILKKATAFNAMERYRSAREMKYDLEQLDDNHHIRFSQPNTPVMFGAANLQPFVPNIPPIKPVQKKSSLSVLLIIIWGIAGGLLVILLCVLLIF